MDVFVLEQEKGQKILVYLSQVLVAASVSVSLI
jgi:hypothetical protein